MWRRLTLKKRIYLILAAMVIISAGAGLVTIWYTFQVEKMITSIIDRHVVSFQTAEALENALINQKGFVSYYFLEGDPSWLQKLGEYRRIFDERLAEARELDLDREGQADLARIDAKYRRYIALKDQIIGRYKAGQRDAGVELNKQTRQQYFDILDLCEAYKQAQVAGIRAAQKRAYAQTAQLRVIVVAAAAAGFALVAVLALILAGQVLNPITRLLRTVFPEEDQGKPDNVVTALSQSVAGLIHNVDQTQSELAKSREHLLQAEKMAMVGKLAAGMAHSLRNPFTSVKMRLFSLGRALQLTPAQKEDFEVISEEIRHIDTIVQNFLEFSRPPKLVMQSISPSMVVDNTLQLLSHRLKSYGVTIRLIRPQKLPQVSADPEQLKEVLANLVINACEAFDHHGGVITIEEEVIQCDGGRRASVRLSDSGPGIPDAIRGQVFQPFFTTKEDGTGLGLSIAHRIMEEHGGSLFLASEKQGGAVFIVTLPIEEYDGEYDTYY